MKTQILFKMAVLLLVAVIFISCNKDEQPEGDYFILNENDFLFLPQSPKSSQDVSIITYDCGYNEFASLKIEGNSIELKKRFTSQMKWPCILENDTIELGKLAAGTYEVTFVLVDTNPFIIDSVSVQEVKGLVVSN